MIIGGYSCDTTVLRVVKCLNGPCKGRTQKRVQGTSLFSRTGRDRIQEDIDVLSEYRINLMYRYKTKEKMEHTE